MATTLLIVDDHAGFRGFARALMEAEGLDVVGEAEDGQSALAEAARLDPDIVLLDVMLPGLDGFEVCDRLTALPTRPAIVLTSSRDASSYADRLARSPARGFVAKHALSAATLLSLIEDASWSPVLAILDAVTGVMLLAAGAVSWRGRPRSRVGALLVLAALCWFAGSVVGALAFLHRGPLVQLHVSYPTGRVQRRLAAGVIVLAWVAAVVEGLRAAPWLTLGLSTLVAVAALDIFTRSSGNARKAGGPALVCALLFAGVLAASSVNRLLGLHLDMGIAATYDVVVMLVAAWLTFDLLVGRWTDATVADLISQLGGEPDPRGLQAALRRALGDPSLVVGYYVASRAAYVDDTGTPLEVRPTGDQVVTTVEEGAAPVAVIIHAASALDDPELVRAATSAVRLAVGNVGLRQRVHDQMDALTQARRRIVEAADRQRSLVAARLEDGAGRHLARVDTLLASLDAAELRSELAQTRADLLDLAHGVRPHELAQEGLGGAVTALAARSATPTTVDLRLGRMRPAVESALYFVCAEALTNLAKHADAQSVVIRGRETDGWAAVEVADDGSGSADPAGSGLRGLADRVEALGGQFRVDTTGDRGTVVSARIPLATGDLR